MNEIHVHLLPALTTPQQLAGQTVVVIDVLRATTTITQALASGAAAVIPCLEVDEARQIAAKIGDSAVLGGERQGLLIDGFDLGNSPQEYTPQSVGGKTVVFSTTNGTRAMMHCRQASEVLIGAFVNFSAVCHRLGQRQRVHLLCAGTYNQITREDVLLAGAIVDDLFDVHGRDSYTLNDQAEIACDAWRTAAGDLAGLDPLARALRASHGGRNMLAIGQERDIEIAAEVDRFDVVGRLYIDPWEIRVA